MSLQPPKFVPHVAENHADMPGLAANSCGRYRFSSDIFKYVRKALRPRHEHAQTARKPNFDPNFG